MLEPRCEHVYSGKGLSKEKTQGMRRRRRQGLREDEVVVNEG